MYILTYFYIFFYPNKIRNKITFGEPLNEKQSLVELGIVTYLLQVAVRAQKV